MVKKGMRYAPRGTSFAESLFEDSSVSHRPRPRGPLGRARRAGAARRAVRRPRQGAQIRAVREWQPAAGGGDGAGRSRAGYECGAAGGLARALLAAADETGELPAAGILAVANLVGTRAPCRGNYARLRMRL